MVDFVQEVSIRLSLATLEFMVGAVATTVTVTTTRGAATAVTTTMTNTTEAAHIVIVLIQFAELVKL